jgi:uncharacterized protein YuzE
MARKFTIIDSHGDVVAVKPFSAVNATESNGTTPRTVKAAVAGKRHWIASSQVSQRTAAESGMVIIEDDTGTPVVHLRIGFNGIQYFPSTHAPYIEVAAGKAINVRQSGAVGNVHACIQGFVEE